MYTSRIGLSRTFYFVNKDFLIFYEEFIKRALDRDLLFNGAVDRLILEERR